MTRDVSFRPTAGQLLFHPLWFSGGGTEMARFANTHQQIVVSDQVLQTALVSLIHSRMRARSSSMRVAIRPIGLVRSILTAFRSAVPTEMKGFLAINWNSDDTSLPSDRPASTAAALEQFWQEVVLPEHGLFVASSDDPYLQSPLFMPSPAADDGSFEAVGRVLAKCIVDGIPISPKFAPALLKRLCMKSVNLHDLELFSPATAIRAHRLGALGEINQMESMVSEELCVRRSRALDALYRGFASVPGIDPVLNLSAAQLSMLLSLAQPVAPKQVAAGLKFIDFECDSQTQATQSLLENMICGLSWTNLRRFLYATVGTCYLSQDTNIYVHHVSFGNKFLQLPCSLAIPPCDERQLSNLLIDLLTRVDIQ